MVVESYIGLLVAVLLNEFYKLNKSKGDINLDKDFVSLCKNINYYNKPKQPSFIFFF